MGTGRVRGGEFARGWRPEISGNEKTKPQKKQRSWKTTGSGQRATDNRQQTTDNRQRATERVWQDARTLPVDAFGTLPTDRTRELEPWSSRDAPVVDRREHPSAARGWRYTIA